MSGDSLSEFGAVETYDIEYGRVDFRAFALRCARSLGWPVPPERHEAFISPAYADAAAFEREIETSKVKLAEFSAMTLADAETICQQNYREELARYCERQRELDEKRAKYDTMLADALRWNPPEELLPVRDLMITSLRKARSRWLDYSPPEPKDAEVWLAEEIARAKRDIAENPHHIARLRREAEARERQMQTLYRALP